MSPRKASTSKTSGVPFELFAPNNKEVALKGSWDNWQPVKMKRGKDGIWRTEAELPDGEYEYKFELISRSEPAKGRKIEVADPAALRMNGERETGVIQVQGGKPVVTSYKWRHDDVPLPENRDLIIYEMHLGDFRGGPGDEKAGPGTFKNFLDKLDYLADLGINAIELLPLNAAMDSHWGYSQRSLWAVEAHYGTPDGLCRLVDACHGRGIRVIHDTVLNHMNPKSPLAEMDFDYWFYEENPDPPHLHFGPKLNYEFYDETLKQFPAREHVIRALQFWISAFHLDGIRFDLTQGLKFFDLLKWFNDEAHERAEFKPFYTIAEHLPEDPAITGPDGPIDAAWHHNFYYQILAAVLGVPYYDRDPYDTGALLRLLDGRNDGYASPWNTVKYSNNHDQERTMHLLGAEAHVFDDPAFRRDKLGASLLLTAPGIPMIWMGQEFGQPTPKSLERQPLWWSLLENERNQDLFQHYKKLIAIRKANPALTSENIEVVADDPERKIIACKRWDGSGNLVLVAANLRDEHAGEYTFHLSGIEDGRWHEMIYSYEVDSSGGTLTDALGPSEAKVYVKC